MYGAIIVCIIIDQYLEFQAGFMFGKWTESMVKENAGADSEFWGHVGRIVAISFS